MISERQFSEQFSGFWNHCLPFLTPQVVAAMNMQGVAMPNSRGFVLKPLKFSEDSSNSDLVADTGFGIFAAAVGASKSVDLICNTELFEKVLESAAERISRLRNFEGKATVKQLDVVADSIEIANRLEIFLKNQSNANLVIQPHFKGCGILDSCYGDVFAGSTIYEVKCVERNLRSIDIRQIITYCALNYQSQNLVVKDVCIVNPRRGVWFKFNVESLAQKISGRNSAELFHQIVDFLTNFETIQPAS